MEEIERLKKQIDDLTKELKSAVGEHAAMLAGRIDTLQRQVDAIDVKMAGRIGGGADFGSAGSVTERLIEKMKQDEMCCRTFRDKKGNFILNFSGDDCLLLERKSTLLESGVGFTTTGVMPLDRIPGITPEARQQLTLRDLLSARATNQAIVDFVKVSAGPKIASPQTEGSDKGENAVTFTSVSEKVQTIATWIPASRQILDDMSELAAFISGSLAYYVSLEEEREMLSGAGTTDLHGLIPQATAFDSSLLTPSSGWSRIDVLGAAVEQINIAKEIPPTFGILNPVDWWKIRRTKTSFGTYLLGDPGTVGRARLWDLTIVPTVSMASGYFLVGSGDPAAVEIRDRMEMQVEVSTSHADYFTRNLCAVRGERRCALICRRPASFIYGAFSTSPA